MDGEESGYGTAGHFDKRFLTEKAIMKTIITILFCALVLCGASNAQNYVAKIDTFGKTTGIPNAIYFEPESYPMFARLVNGYELRLFPATGVGIPVLPETKKALPLEWRGASLSLDAANRFDNRFVKMDFGASATAVIGYRQYEFHFETIAPLSSQGFSYRLRFKYQVF